MKHKNIVTIGGGSGQFVLLSGLRDLRGIDITAIVSMTDSGGSTGRLRDELGVLPPGDILKCILALSTHRDIVRTILLQRFKSIPRLKGHNAGNMLLTMLYQYTGSFPNAIQALAEILYVRGTILPVSTDKATLVAELTDGSRVYGEKAIDQPRGTQNEKIVNVFLVPHHSDAISVYPPVMKAIAHADYVVIGPGDLFTSIIPHFIISDVRAAIQQTKAKVLYVVNVMTKFGETHNFTGYDFVKTLEDFIGKPVDGVVYNTRKPQQEILEQYRKQKAEFVEIDPQEQEWRDYKIYSADLLDTSGGVVRHNPEKLSGLINEIIF